MNRIIIVFFFIIFSSQEVFTQNTIRFNEEYKLKSIVSMFINNLNDSSSNIAQYAVFVVNVYKNDSDSTSNSYCFTIGYILNSFDYDHVLPNYFFRINNSIVTIINESERDVSIFNCFEPQIIDATNEKMIRQKLLSSEIGGFTYRSKAMQYCYEFSFYRYTVHENSDWIPEKEHIDYNYLKKHKNKTE